MRLLGGCSEPAFERSAISFRKFLLWPELVSANLDELPQQQHSERPFYGSRLPVFVIYIYIYVKP